jgi:preprotein translocase subunit SecF
MRIRSSALNTLILSAVFGAAALALSLIGAGMRFNFGAGATMDYTAFLFAILAAVLFSFVFGWVRYDLASALALSVASLHDLLLATALTSLMSNLFGLSTLMPALVFSGLSFTYCLTIPLLREARSIAKGTSLREMSREQVAVKALGNTRVLAWLTSAAAALLLLVFIISGNLNMLGAVLPLLMSLAAALLSSHFITPFIWAAFIPQRKAKK